MANKSRPKRHPGISDLATMAADIRRATNPEEAATGAAGSTAAVASGTAGGRGTRQAVGARVARVAVDDQTWAAFRNLCSPTPASIRLGELVIAEVERSRKPATEPDLAAAVQAIRSQVDKLEALVRRAAPPT